MMTANHANQSNVNQSNANQNNGIDKNGVMQLMKSRRSIGILKAPAPSQAELEAAIGCALTAPDHRQLTPWRFYSISGEGLESFADLLVTTAQENGETSAEKLARVAKHPSRAPMIIVCVTKIVPHLKVPTFEQLLATGAAVQNMLLAFESMGYGTMWRSGDAVLSATLKEKFGAGDDDYIAGFIYVGTKSLEPKTKPPRTVADFLSEWNG